MFHADAGVLDPHNAMAAMLRLAAANGADVRFGTPVTRLEPTRAGDGAVAHTDSGTFTAPVIAVAAGAWIAPLLDGVVGLPPLTVTQQQVFHFAPVQALGKAAPWPIFVHKDGVDDCYGLTGGRDGEVPGAIKIGEHARLPADDRGGPRLRGRPGRPGPGSRLRRPPDPRPEPPPRSTR